jgi:hypothetical protein
MISIDISWISIGYLLVIWILFWTYPKKISTHDIHTISRHIHDISSHIHERYPSILIQAISLDIHEYPNEISTQDILWISKIFILLISRDIQTYPHHLSIGDILWISNSKSNTISPWISKLQAASKSRTPQWQPRLLWDGLQISPEWLNPKELQPLRLTCPGAADAAWPASA